MANKFYGKVGYGATVETPANSGKWVKVITERPYRGDIVRNSRKLEGETEVNADITVGNSISIVADAYALNNFHAMLYVEWAGSLWIVSNVDVQAPRLLLRLGGVYNGKKAQAPSAP